jgi:hypothetical protein
VASVLAEALIKEGIDVTLFATGDSITGAALDSVTDKPTSGMNVLPVSEE